jgi:hypothetical protein
MGYTTPMKTLLLALAAASNTQNVNLIKHFHDVSVELQDGKDDLAILVRDQGHDPAVTWEDKGLCDDVAVKSISHLPGGVVKIVTVPSFEMDDGVNECAVTVTQPNGDKATVSMFIDLD